MKKRVYLQILLPVLMTLIVLSVTNYFIVLSQKDYQSRVAERLLQYSERVAGQLADAIEVAESSGIAGCTPAGINLLRTIRQKNKYPYNAPTYQPLGRWDGIFHYIPPSF
ncbi:hypothetical protein [Klebsiella pneumoniae]|uniref:hypothetical protein n=1 Tax=Klebsiella pneumoniae TaxID=573 RepID=UPI00388B9573